MANEQNLRPFNKTDNPPPPNRGRKKGSRSRGTIIKKWLEAKTNVKNPLTDKDERLTVEDELVFAMIAEAKTGNVAAFRELMDSVFGKLSETRNVKVDLEELSDEELEAITGAS